MRFGGEMGGQERGKSSHTGTTTLQCKAYAAGPSEAVLSYEQQSLNGLYCEEVELRECEA